MGKKKTYRSHPKPYLIRLGNKEPHRVPAADWQRYRKLGLIAPVVNDGVESHRVAQLARGVVAWLEAGRIVLQNLLTKATEYIRTSWAWIERNAPCVVGEETIYYWHCLNDRERAMWDAQRAVIVRGV